MWKRPEGTHSCEVCARGEGAGSIPPGLRLARGGRESGSLRPVKLELRLGPPRRVHPSPSDVERLWGSPDPRARVRKPRCKTKPQPREPFAQSEVLLSRLALRPRLPAAARPVVLAGAASSWPSRARACPYPCPAWGALLRASEGRVTLRTTWCAHRLRRPTCRPRGGSRTACRGGRPASRCRLEAGAHGSAGGLWVGSERRLPGSVAGFEIHGAVAVVSRLVPARAPQGVPLCSPLRDLGGARQTWAPWGGRGRGALRPLCWHRPQGRRCGPAGGL